MLSDRGLDRVVRRMREPCVRVVVALELGFWLSEAALLFRNLFEIFDPLHLNHLIVLLMKRFLELEYRFVFCEERMLKGLFCCDTFGSILFQHFRKKIDSVAGYVLVLFGFEVELSLFVFVQDRIAA